MKKITKDQIIKIATEMHEVDCKKWSESYSEHAWNIKSWPEVDDDIIYKAIDAYATFLRCIDQYNNVEKKEYYRKKDILGRIIKNE